MSKSKQKAKMAVMSCNNSILCEFLLILPLQHAHRQLTSPERLYSVSTYPGAAGVIDLKTSDQLIKSDSACLIAILADALACDEDLNESHVELRRVLKQLAYLVVDEGLSY